MKRITILICLVAFGIACTQVRYLPPEPLDVRRSAILVADYDKVWDAAVDWFATRNITIGKLDKSAGYVNAENLLLGNFEILDCGSAEGLKPGWGGFGEPIVMLNFTIRRVGDDRTQLNVNIKGRAVFWVDSVGSRERRAVDCTSTGVLEETIFSFVESVAAGPDGIASPSPQPFEVLPRAKQSDGESVEMEI